MGFFNKDKNNDKYTKLFEKYYLQSLNVLSKLEIASNSEKELLPIMIVISDFSCSKAGKDKTEITSKMIKFLNEKYIHNQCEYDVFLNRMNFYTEVIFGKELRAEWLFGNMDGINRNPIIDCCIGLGDILVNPDCANDYENGSIMVHDIFDVMEFSTHFTSEIFPYMAEFYNKIYRV